MNEGADEPCDVMFARHPYRIPSGCALVHDITYVPVALLDTDKFDDSRPYFAATEPAEKTRQPAHKMD